MARLGQLLIGDAVDLTRLYDCVFASGGHFEHSQFCGCQFLFSVLMFHTILDATGNMS